ncbi:MAG: biotin synthase BioB [bacterium]
MFSVIKKADQGRPITQDEAERLYNISDSEILFLLATANKIKIHHFGNKVDLCSLINAKSGNCPENCTFCSQSIHSNTNINTYKLVSKETILTRATEMERAGAHRFCIVISGRTINRPAERRRILESIELIKSKTNLRTCASLGFLDTRWAESLVNSGLDRYHHNLETARSFFPQICTTHSYEQRIETVLTAHDAGLEVCCGGIWGLGESPQQRIELAFTLRELPVTSIPINLLNPIPGTPLEHTPLEPPLNHLKMVAIYRLIFPTTEIRFAGGREINLRQLQPLGLLAGANGLMIGHYLTTLGRNIKDDLSMLADLNLSFGDEGEISNNKKIRKSL